MNTATYVAQQSGVVALPTPATNGTEQDELPAKGTVAPRFFRSVLTTAIIATRPLRSCATPCHVRGASYCR